MFERRVKILLAILIVFTVGLLVRAMQVQVLQRDTWRQEAVAVMTHPDLIDTTRGRLLDRRGQVIAEDKPCIDACVDYRAISLNEEWLKEQALARLRSRMGPSGYAQTERSQRQKLLDQEIENVKTDIHAMWITLANEGGLHVDEIDQIAQSIRLKVEGRRRAVWYSRYKKAIKTQRDQNQKEEPAWYKRWLVDDTNAGPDLDQFDIAIADQTAPHIILHAINNDTYVRLGKQLDRYPGLVLQPGMHRYYPFEGAGSQLIGHLSKVDEQDIKKDPNDKDPLRRYEPNDLIGNTGLEALCEPLLRGTRGLISKYVGERAEDSRIVENTPPVPGQDVHTTLDMALQQDIQDVFKRVVIQYKDGSDTVEMPGAAVVIDVPTGELLALVSAPGYDNNKLDELYPKLVQDGVDRRLMNRATQFALEPGSTVKPMVGLAAMTQGVFPTDGTIECTGYLVINGKTYKEGRCWVASMYANKLLSVAHHPVPYEAPHPTGFLTFPDALERSCNVFFETLADRLGMDGLAHWFDKFGLGRPVGLGIPEVAGQVPDERRLEQAMLIRSATWFSGIGQSQVLATPIQMANVAATIARNGVWVRPRLIPPTLPLKIPNAVGPDVVDLHLNPTALYEAREGMTRVVNGPAGTGKTVKRNDLLVAGKTGSAQAGHLVVYERDAAGNVLREPKIYRQIGPDGIEREYGWLEKIKRDFPVGTREKPNPEAPWYRGYGDDQDRISHAWYIGFAPADHPRIAFAVMVEYGGSGGVTSGYVASKLLDACIAHGYLARSERPIQPADLAAAGDAH